MNIPTHREDDTSADTLPRYKSNSSKDEKTPNALHGLSEAAVEFRFDQAAVFPGISKQPRSLREARLQVEDLLKDAGVTPPTRQKLKKTLDLAIDRIPQDQPSLAVDLMPASKAVRGVKHCFDIIIGVLALIVFAPLMGLITLALIIEGGPVFYFQKRVGRAYRRFNCVKFRTMRPDAEDRLNLLLACNDAARAEWRVHQKLTDDPRVTRLGRLLRESSLDELPQLFNVLRGEMSLVGPRPIVAPEISGYDADRAYFGSVAFDDYVSCLPGITGLWQVSGRHKTIYLDRVRLDRQYARTWSFWLDLKIIWKTVGVVLRRSGR